MSTDKQSRGALWQLLLGEVLIGSVGVFVHEGGQDPVTTVFYRCLFGALFLGVWGAWGGHLNGVIRDHRFVLAAVASGVLLVLGWVALFAGMERSSIGVATMLFHCYPFVMLIMAAVLLGERTHPADWAWTLLAFIGLVGSADPQRLLSEMNGAYETGIALTLLSGVLCAASLLLSRRISKQRAIAVVAIQCCTGAVLLGGFSSPVALQAGTHWFWLIGLGIIHSGLAYVLCYSAYRHLAIATIAVVSFVYPLMALLLDYVLYGQRLNAVQVIGVFLIVLATLGVSLKWRFWFRRSAASVVRL